MVKKDTKNIKNKYRKKVERKHFKTPTDTWWGKAVVWIIFFGMVGVLVLALILAIVQDVA